MKAHLSSRKVAIFSFTAIGSATILLAGASAQAISADDIAPIYNPVFSGVWGDETQYNLPANSPNASAGYWFETTKDDIKVNALGFPAFLQNWTAANPFTVRLYKYQLSSNTYTQLAQATFTYAPGPGGINPNYTFKNGYYWQDVPVVSLGAKSNTDADVWFTTMAEGNYSVNNGLPYLAGGTGTFADVAVFDGNGFSQTGDADFPFPQYTLVDGSNVPLYGLFNPNVSYEVPSPLPLLGAGVAFGYARRMRSRIKLSSDRRSISVASEKI
jgi:hypothetical protein